MTSNRTEGDGGKWLVVRQERMFRRLSYVAQCGAGLGDGHAGQLLLLPLVFPRASQETQKAALWCWRRVEAIQGGEETLGAVVVGMVLDHGGDEHIHVEQGVIHRREPPLPAPR